MEFFPRDALALKRLEGRDCHTRAIKWLCGSPTTKNVPVAAIPNEDELLSAQAKCPNKNIQAQKAKLFVP